MKNTIGLSIIIYISLFTFSCDLEEIPDGGNPGETPTACFTFNVLDDPCSANCEVQFTNCSQNSDSYEWDFGDGANSTDASPLHQYVNSGSFTVKLVATNETASDEISAIVSISNQIETPLACFTFQVLESGPCESNCRVQFTNCSQKSNSYEWDFGDGQTSSEINPLHSFSSPGTYAVQLVSTNSIGSDDTSSNVIIDGVDHVYVAGYETNASGVDVAKYWKNGIPVELTNGNYDAHAMSIFIDQGDVYVAGYEKISEDIYVTKYWKNGVSYSLEERNYPSEPYTLATSIYVTSSNVYVAGYDIAWLFGADARYWENGVPTQLTDGTNVSLANSIFVSGGEVYVAGAEVNANSEIIAAYWRNGIKYELDEDYVGIATEIMVIGDDVYVTGSGYVASGEFVAKYWKNGWATQVSPTDGSIATSIAVSGNDVYISGNEQNSSNVDVAKYWKNDVPHNLTSGVYAANANSIFVLGDDVYVAGFEMNNQGNRVAKCWLNGTETILSDPSYYATAESVFVVER